VAVTTGQAATSPRGRIAPGARYSGPWLLLGAVLALGFLPHAVAYAENLQEREHYQFFPLAWMGAAYLLWARRGSLKPRGDVAAPVVGWAGVALSAVTLAAAGVLNSSWLGMVALVPLALGLAWLVGGRATVMGVVPALIMFATTLRLPGDFDAELIRELRGLAVRFSSRILDLAGIIHVPWGSVIRVPGGDLLVDEACSGINSLVSVLAIVTFLGLVMRRRPLHLVLLLVGSVGIVILANVMRVTIVTVASARWNIDLLKGWKHDALGVALYTVSLSLAASLDQLLLLLGAVFSFRGMTRLGRAGGPYSHADPGPPPGESGADSPDARRPPARRPIRRHPISTASGAAGSCRSSPSSPRSP
jgi:exosortase